MKVDVVRWKKCNDVCQNVKRFSKVNCFKQFLYKFRLISWVSKYTFSITKHPLILKKVYWGSQQIIHCSSKTLSTVNMFLKNNKSKLNSKQNNNNCIEAAFSESGNTTSITINNCFQTVRNAVIKFLNGLQINRIPNFLNFFM